MREVRIFPHDLSQISLSSKEQSNEILKIWVEDYCHAPVENVIFIIEESTNSVYLKSVTWNKPSSEYERNELCYWQSIRRALLRRVAKGKWIVIKDQALPTSEQIHDTKENAYEHSGFFEA